ncbi:MAG TPA: glycosyltransferase family 4 protein [Cyclobacteriaceae bacterium]|nr:glycosyltransferase family 4 protein [Cyclobacteriaceae bacterium]
MKKRRLIYIDQLVGPTSLDIINALTRHYTVHLYYGGIIKTYAELSSEVVLFKRPAYSKKSMPSRVISWLSFYALTLPPLLFKRKPEVFLVSNPPLNFYVGHWFRKLFGSKFTLLLFDIYPDIIVQSGYMSRNGMIARIWSAWNRAAFPKAHRIFTLSESLAAEVGKYEPSIGNLRVVPNWVDSNLIKPIPRESNQFILRYSLQDYFIVMYSGNMGKTHDIETIVEAANLLRDYSRIRFILIGDGEKRPKLEQMVASYGLDNLMMLPFQSPEQFRHSIASPDIGFVTLAEGFENFSVPSKTYYLMAAGCILFAIGSKESEMELLIKKYECGYRFDPSDHKSVAAGILNVYKNIELREKLHKNSRQASSNFTVQNAIRIADETSGA